VGHLHTLVLTDALARWRRLLGGTAVLVTGTDEHGLKVQQAAQRAGVAPQAHCDTMAARFACLAAAAGCDVADTVRTTEPRHRVAVHALWRTLADRGHIYKGEHAGWYSVPDEGGRRSPQPAREHPSHSERSRQPHRQTDRQT
jgi:methionyl-tRNA synthetase